MDAFALGPLLIPLPRLYALFVAVCLLGVSAILLSLPRRRHVRWFSGLILVWLVSARLGHVVLNPESYAHCPLDTLRFWLPGYDGAFGLAGALLWSAWTLRDRLGALLGAAGLCITASLMWLALAHWAPLSSDMTLRQLPELSLTNLEGDSVALSELQDQHLLINLWASWCPPCRREMPLLAEFDAHDDVTVVAINQGEDLLSVVRYLDDGGLAFRHTLLDPRQHMMVESAAPGLPVTLLFDSQGRARRQHVGELSRATLDDWLKAP